MEGIRIYPPDVWKEIEEYRQRVPAPLRELLTKQDNEVWAYARSHEHFTELCGHIGDASSSLKGLSPSDRRLVIKILIETTDVLEQVGTEKEDVYFG
jgi:hypothetical protein